MYVINVFYCTEKLWGQVKKVELLQQNCIISVTLNWKDLGPQLHVIWGEQHVVMSKGFIP